jgi:hypothetical protein
MILGPRRDSDESADVISEGVVGQEEEAVVLGRPRSNRRARKRQAKKRRSLEETVASANPLEEVTAVSPVQSAKKGKTRAMGTVQGITKKSKKNPKGSGRFVSAFKLRNMDRHRN